MVKKRVIETTEGIQNELTVEIFDEFARTMRDKGWNNVDRFIKVGITKGNVLEIGPGPGYIGLEWLKQSENARLTGLEISSNMIKLAIKNAKDYEFENKVNYVHGNCNNMPFDANSFDAVFSNGSLHEWENPIEAFNEIHRILKPGGIFCITDMKRDVNPILKWIIYFSTKPKEIRPGFLTSLNAAYTINELDQLFSQTNFNHYHIKKEVFGLCASGQK
jgi:ubiquinone/menaquinone biosynthesis C-methylase UbiE